MNYETDVLCLNGLQQEALTCLNGFPNKVRALNDIITTYAPEDTKKTLENSVQQLPMRLQTDNKEEVFTQNCNPGTMNTVSDTSGSILRQRLSKRKNHRSKRRMPTVLRRRPGPLSHILAFLSNGLAACTQATMVKPSRYIANQALSMLRDILIQRDQIIRVHCSPSRIWSMPKDTKTVLELQKMCFDSNLDTCIRIMRPATTQLIADTMKLKRWLQALAVNFTPPSPTLAHAIRRTETIDRWAYNLFFQLKYLEKSRISNYENEAAELQSGKILYNEVRNKNLWHQLVHLRDNYVFLYETLHNNQFCVFQEDTPIFRDDRT